MPKQLDLDQAFHALSNRTRREVFEQLCLRSAPVSELAKAHDMALPSFLQHLSVLEEAELVRSRKKGRVRTFEALEVPMVELSSWLDKQRSVWEQRLNQFDAYVEDTFGAE